MYSRSIHGIYVCVGYVSGMYRECVDTSEGRKRYQDCATARETTIQLQGYCKDNLDNFGDNLDNFGDNEDNDSQQWRQCKVFWG